MLDDPERWFQIGKKASDINAVVQEKDQFITNIIRQKLLLQGYQLSSSIGAVKLRLSSEVAVITGIHISAVLLRRDRTSGSADMVEDIISSTSSNFADSLSNSLAISS